MASSEATRERISVRELMKDSKKTNALLRAWKRIKELPPDNPNSFFAIAGFHGEPFVPSQVGTDSKTKQWGGYCQHSNVLFPFWHRFYLKRLEHALQTVCPEDDIMLPYWDQTSDESLKNGIPDLFTKEKVTIDGVEEDNPLRSFILPQSLGKNEADTDYVKPKGYETVRYPYSGKVGTAEDAEVAEKHNQGINADYSNIESVLNEHIVGWLLGQEENMGPDWYKHYKGIGISKAYTDCLHAPNYNLFSNTSSAGQKSDYGITALESPHNMLHLAIGGFSSAPSSFPQEGYIPGANGDMGENETAGFDPIFHFHHCNVDRMFWLWQKKNGKTSKLEISEDKNDPGITPDAGQGPTPYQENGQKLSLDTPLHPFQQYNGLPQTARNGINIQTQLGYTYSVGSMDTFAETAAVKSSRHIKFQKLKLEEEAEFLKEHMKAGKDIKVQEGGKGDLTKTTIEITVSGTVIAEAVSSHLIMETFVTVSNIDVNAHQGSFVVYLSWKSPEGAVLLGREAFLSRINRKVCSNCQQRPQFRTAVFNITDIASKGVKKEDLVASTSEPVNEAGEEEKNEMFIRMHRVYTPESLY